VCDSPDQAAHYHSLGPKLGTSSLILHLAGLGVKVVYFRDSYMRTHTNKELGTKMLYAQKYFFSLAYLFIIKEVYGKIIQSSAPLIIFKSLDTFVNIMPLGSSQTLNILI
jgi:hypothetical protein